MFLFLLSFAFSIERPRMPRNHKVLIPKGADKRISCQVCKQVIAYVEELINDQKVEDEITKQVKLICQSFPTPYSSLCTSVAEMFISSIIEFIKAGLESSVICTQIGLCENVAKKPLRLMKPNHPSNGLACDMCVKVVDLIGQFVNDDLSDEEISQRCQKTCDSFNAPYDSICDFFVEQFHRFIIHQLRNGKKTKEVCISTSLCINSVKPTINRPKISPRKPVTQRKFTQHKLVLPSNYNNDYGCDMCKTVVDYIIKLLQDETVEQKIIDYVSELCQSFPEPYGALCDSLSYYYIPLIIEMIKSQKDSTAICVKIGLCVESKCETCRNWIRWSRKQMKTVSVPHLWEMISNECPKVSHLKNFCQMINEKNIATFANLVSSTIPPEEACHWANFC
ncbi:hypothetical protein TRFO_35419 [Tritrichomonas foetus]|uniref:Saposin B-type domain-containing protein n=1 Tax=Tritrichomonas foetus TaxID=1144522 RepID=A0A1J4JLS0_9EUKA|nr:hypothetical protein TRFO_35419 [Tritrichomonas foetus]|eukprot:OHS98220.1 hypothetical protein TRFO_35419 [Tritrichomonas foetus]